MLLFPRNRKSPLQGRRRLLLERLDYRALLTGVTAVVLDGVATVSGSSADDEIIIAPMPQRDELHVFDQGQCISAWQNGSVREITVRSFAGDDLIRVADSVAQLVQAVGGAGFDTVLIDRPQVHRHGWIFEVERVMAEGEFAGDSAVPNDPHSAHAGHGTSQVPSPIELSPIPTDHVHVEMQRSEPIQDDFPVAPSHDHSQPFSAPSVHSSGTSPGQGITSANSSIVVMPHGSPIDHEMVPQSDNEATADPATAGLNSRTTSESGGHAGHPAMEGSTGGQSLTSGHAGHDALAVSFAAQTSSGAHPDHHASAGPSGSAGHSVHAGHTASGGLSPGGEHAGHADHSGSAGSASGGEHSGHSDHGGSAVSITVEEFIVVEPGSATARKSGHGHHAGRTSHPGASGHGHAGHSGPGAKAAAVTGANAHAGHGTPQCSADSDDNLIEAGHHHHPASSTNRSTPDCHSSAENRTPDIADSERSTLAAKQQDAETGDLVVAKISRLATLLTATGILWFVCVVRPWRSTSRTNGLDEEHSRLAFEWLDSRGVPAT